MSERIRLTAQTYRQAFMIVPFALCIMVLLISTSVLLSGTPIESDFSGPVLALMVLGVYAAFGGATMLAWRTMTMALYSTRSTLSIRAILRTRTVRWSDVAAVRSVPDNGFGLPPGRHTLWLRLRSGRQIRLPVQRRATAWEEAFIVMLRHEDLVLSRADYLELLVDLRRYRKRARRAALRRRERQSVVEAAAHGRPEPGEVVPA